MKKIILSIFLSVSVLSYALKEIDGVLYREYDNSRFGFAVDYPPEVLFMQPPPIDDDGRSFLSEDQEGEMTVYGTYFLSPSIDSVSSDANAKKLVRNNYYYNLDNDYANAKITYQKLNEADGWYVISGMMNGKVFYHKVRLIAGADPYFMVFEMKYPIGEKGTYDKILESISKSIKY